MRDLQELITGWLPGWTGAAEGPLPGGERNDVFRVEHGGRSYALRLYAAPSTLATVGEEHEVVTSLAPRISEICAPITTTGGIAAVEFEGRVATLSRFADGARLDRDNPNARRAAAKLLARIHVAAWEY